MTKQNLTGNHEGSIPFARSPLMQRTAVARTYNGPYFHAPFLFVIWLRDIVLVALIWLVIAFLLATCSPAHADSGKPWCARHSNNHLSSGVKAEDAKGARHPRHQRRAVSMDQGSGVRLVPSTSMDLRAGELGHPLSGVSVPPTQFISGTWRAGNANPNSSDDRQVPQAIAISMEGYGPNKPCGTYMVAPAADSNPAVPLPHLGFTPTLRPLPPPENQSLANEDKEKAK